VGAEVEGRFMGDAEWYPGSVVVAHCDGTYDIQYTDGDFEEKVAASHLRPAPGGSSSSSEAPTPAATTAHGSHATASGLLRDANRAARYVVKQLLARCQKKEEGAEFRPLLGHLVDDLLAAVLLPEWPGAETLLQALAHALTRDLQAHSAGALDTADDAAPTTPRAGSAAAAAQGESAYLGMALEVLGRICTRLRSVVRRDRDAPLVLPEAVEVVDEAAGPLDAGQVVGCPCGIAVNHGGFMLVSAFSFSLFGLRARGDGHLLTVPRLAALVALLPAAARTATDATAGFTRRAWACPLWRPRSRGFATTAS